MAASELVGRVHALESFGSVDGPGVRFVIFLQGCAMRCRYCHNPDTWACGAGEVWTAPALLQRALRYRSYWGKAGEQGGITVSGGEPLLQLDFVAELFRLARAQGVSTVLDTAGQPFCEGPAWLARLDGLLANTSLVILDLKEWDAARHKALTGHDNTNILAFARYCAAHGVPLWVRHVLVPGLTDGKEDLRAMRAFLDTLPTLQRVEVLPYHALGVYKWEALGVPYSLHDAQPPTLEQLARAKALLGAE